MRSLRSLAVVVSFALTSPALAQAPTAVAPAPATKKAEKCEHGVRKSLCSRCNPKLEPVFKAKNDWCAEHSRPESQCAICSPELAKQGIK